MASTVDAKNSSTADNEKKQTITPRSSEEEPQEEELKSRLKHHLTSPIQTNFLAEAELLILTFCTGIQDATTFPDYHCFASNQTGNTVMLAMAVLLPDVTYELFVTENIGVALTLFLIGVWATGQLGHIVGVRSRLWIIFCNLIQTILVFIAAAIQHFYGVELRGTRTLIIVGLLALAAGSQVVLSRSLALTEISTAMATAAWVDLVNDRKLFAMSNRARTRRIAFLIVLFGGAFFGAFIYRSLGSAAALFFSAIGKLIVTFMFFFNKADGANKFVQGSLV